jgi:hypothetical protein
MKNVVLMASHIRSEKRFEYLQKAIDSLIFQTMKPHAFYLSISFDEKFSNLKEKIRTRELSEHFIFNLFIQQNSLTQFQHYDYIKNFIDDDCIVSFLDDDDLYHKDKILLVNEYFKKNLVNDDVIIMHPSKIIDENNNDMGIIPVCKEYWSKSLSGRKFKQIIKYFKIIEKQF